MPLEMLQDFSRAKESLARKFMCDTCKRDQLSASIPFELLTIIYLLKRRSGHQREQIWGGGGKGLG